MVPERIVAVHTAGRNPRTCRRSCCLPVVKKRTAAKRGSDIIAAVGLLTKVMCLYTKNTGSMAAAMVTGFRRNDNSNRTSGSSIDGVEINSRNALLIRLICRVG